MVQRMGREGLVRRAGAGEVRLTEKGLRLARRSIRRHRLIETWLVRSLGMNWTEAHEEAHQLEHALSPRLEALLDAHLGHPRQDPHGAAIPAADGTMPGQTPTPAENLPDGSEGTVSRLNDRDPERLRYWEELGLKLGACVRRVGSAPFGGPVELRVDGRSVHVGPEALSGIWLDVERRTP